MPLILHCHSYHRATPFHTLLIFRENLDVPQQTEDLGKVPKDQSFARRRNPAYQAGMIEEDMATEFEFLTLDTKRKKGRLLSEVEEELFDRAEKDPLAFVKNNTLLKHLFSLADQSPGMSGEKPWKKGQKESGKKLPIHPGDSMDIVRAILREALIKSPVIFSYLSEVYSDPHPRFEYQRRAYETLISMKDNPEVKRIIEQFDHHRR